MVVIMQAATEAFPLLAFPTSDKSTDLAGPGSNNNASQRRRRKSSRLGPEIETGSSIGLGFATLDVRPTSPTTLKAQRDRDRNNPFVKRRAARNLFRQCKSYALKYTWVIPLGVLALFFLLFAVNPTESNPISHFIFLSYPVPPEAGSPPGTPIQYGKGRWDVAFVTFYVVVLSFTREFIMQIFLRPLARRGGMRSRAKQSRFMEQMYTAIYFSFSSPLGLYVMSQSPTWYFNTRAMYENYPHKTHAALFKFYYLFQAAYWYQQALVMVLGMEAKRKDFMELVGHHFVTLSLIALSYRFHFTYMGLAVFITHDISDFFFATSKVLNYLDHWLVGPYFTVFVFVWIYTRHYLNFRILYSEFNEFKTVGPYGLDWETEQYKCDLSHFISTFLIAALQCLNLFWFYHIVRVAYRFVLYNNHEDDRSDNEEEELEKEEFEQEEEERRENALKHQDDMKIANVEVQLNGHSLNGEATASEIHTNGVTKRK